MINSMWQKWEFNVNYVMTDLEYKKIRLFEYEDDTSKHITTDWKSWTEMCWNVWFEIYGANYKY